MRHSRHPEIKNVRPEDSFYNLPTIVLLTEKHWLYIQRRFHMSPREIHVAKFACQGLSNEQIAKKLKIKTGTIKTHLRNIYRRIHVKNKIAMLLKFVNAIVKSSAKSKTTLPIPIIDLKKPGKKLSTSSDIPQKK